MTDVKRVVWVWMVGVVVGLLLGLVGGYDLGRRCVQDGVTVRDTLTRVDTLTVECPVVRDSVVTRYVRVMAPRAKMESVAADTVVTAEGGDSVAVALAIEQKHYAGEQYEAWVSGYMARLDSVRVTERTTTVRERVYAKGRRWGVGVTAGWGYGLGSGRCDLWVGVGLTYSLIKRR
ncbi:MAG: DUF6808 domain-containing protein [Alloprevotella sp.]